MDSEYSAPFSFQLSFQYECNEQTPPIPNFNNIFHTVWETLFITPQEITINVFAVFGESSALGCVAPTSSAILQSTAEAPPDDKRG